MNFNTEFLVALALAIVCSAPILYICFRVFKWFEAGGFYYMRHPGAKLMDIDKLSYDEALKKVNADKNVK